MAKKILIVDDEPGILDPMCATVTGLGYQVLRCVSGAEALRQLEAHADIRLVISDINMPEVSGIEVLLHVSKHRPDTPVVLVTGFLSENDARDLIDRGCTAFLAKPVLKAELVRLIKSIAESESDGNEGRSPPDYACVPLEHFISGHKALSSIYLQLSDRRFVKLAHEGARLEVAKLRRFQERGVSELWISREDFPKYASVIQDLSAATARKAVAPAMSLRMAVVACEVASESLRMTGVSRDNVAGVIELFQNAMQGLESGLEGMRAWDLLVNVEPTIYSHSAVTGILALMLTQVLGWKSDRNVETLTQAAFLHDAGLYLLPQNLQTLALPQSASEAEKRSYETHPTELVGILKTVPNVAAEVALTILDHHENGSDTGYPRALSRSDIYPMARTLILLDSFVEAWLTQPPRVERNLAAALQILARVGRLPVDAMAQPALEVLLKAATVGDAKRDFQLLQSRR